MNKTYIPNPIDTSSIALPEELCPLLEMLAKNTHENYVKMRIEAGWSYGPRSDVEKTKNTAKKFVRYKEGAERYSIGLTKFQQLAKEAGAVYKVDKIALVNCELFEKYLETFREY